MTCKINIPKMQMSRPPGRRLPCLTCSRLRPIYALKYNRMSGYAWMIKLNQQKLFQINNHHLTLVFFSTLYDFEARQNGESTIQKINEFNKCDIQQLANLNEKLENDITVFETTLELFKIDNNRTAFKFIEVWKI